MQSNIIKKLDIMIEIIKTYKTYSFLPSKFIDIDSIDRFVYDGKKYISRKSIIKNLTDTPKIFNDDDSINLKLLDPLDYKFFKNMSKQDIDDYLAAASKKIIYFLEKKWNNNIYTPGLTYDNTFFIVDYLEDYYAITSDNYKPEYKSKIQNIMNNFDKDKIVFADNQTSNYIVNEKGDVKYCDLDDINTIGIPEYLVIYDEGKCFIKLSDNIFNPNNIPIF